MNKLKIKFLCAFLLTNVFVLVFTAGAGQIAPTVNLDTTQVGYKPLSAEIFNKYRSSGEYNYKQAPPVIHNFLQIILFKIQQFLARVFAHPVSSILLYICFIIIFIILILSLLGADIQSVFSGTRKTARPMLASEDINIQENDLDLLIQTETNAGNFTLAVRYLYLKLLKILANQNFINWQREKTNHDYLNELSSTPYIDEFKSITYKYEWVWYGKFSCANADFERIRRQFETLYKRLNA